MSDVYFNTTINGRKTIILENREWLGMEKLRYYMFSDDNTWVFLPNGVPKSTNHFENEKGLFEI